MRRRILIGMLILPGFITSAPTAKTLTYNGSAQQLVNAGSGSGPMVYSLDNITYSSTTPTATNAGTYTVYYKVEKYKKYDETAPAYVSCTISPKTVTQPTITLSQTSYSYDGTNKTPSVTSVKDGSATIPSSEYTVSYSNNKNAGTATVSITDKSGGNYIVSGTVTFTITKVTPTITAEPTNRNTSYTGSAQALLEGGTANVAGTFTYATATNAGTYNNSQWTFTPTDTTNYNTVTGTVNATIAKINPVITAPTAKTLTYTGSAQTLLNSGSNTTPGTFTYGNNSGTDAGDYYPTWNFAPTDSTNYNTLDGSVKVTIGKKPVTLTWGTVTWTYDGSAHSTTCTAGNLASGDTCTVTLTGNSITNKGTTTVTASSLSNSNYTLPSAKTATLTINARTVTPTAPTGTNRNYTGSAQTIFTAGSCTAGGTMYYNSSNVAFSTSTWSTSMPYTLKTDASTYTIYWYCYVSDTTNNTGTNINTIKSVSATINTVAATLPGTISGDRKDTDHTPARATVSKDYVGGTLQYSTNNGSSWSNVTWYSGNLTANPSNSTIGDVSVKFVVNPDTNHIGSAISDPITLTVTKATDPSVTVSLSSTLTYTGSAQTIATASNTHGIASYYIGYRKDALATADSQITWNSANTTPLQATNAGDYYVYYKFTADSSHSGDKTYTYVGKVTINKKGRSGAVSCNNVTYGSTVTASVSGNTETGTITWGITAGTGTATINSNGVVTPTKAGTVTVTASVAATANYAAYTATSKQITISQRTVTITAPTKTNRTYTGNEQVIFAAGSCTAGGTMYYSETNKTFSTSTWSTSLPYTKKTNAGNYYLYYYCYVSDTTNNTGTNINTILSVVANIAKASQSAPTATGATTTYHNTATASASGGGGVGTLTWTNGNTRTAVGTTTTAAYWSGNANYNASPNSNSVNLVINKATDQSITVTATNKTYNGSAQTVAGVTVHGISNYYLGFGASTTSAPSSWGSANTLISQTNAGTYYIWYKGTADGNHSADISAKYGTSAVISRQTLSSVTITLSWTSKSYNGSVQVPTATVKSGSTTLTSGTHYTLSYSNSSSKNAGSYTITASAASNYSFTAASATYTITKIDPTIALPTAKTLTYNGSALTLLNNGSNTTPGTFTYSNNSGTNAGDYHPSWGFVPTDTINYYGKGGSIQVRIEKATPSITTVPYGRGNVTYTGSNLPLLRNGASSVAGTFTYSQAKALGAYSSATYTFTPSDTTNYNKVTKTISGNVLTTIVLSSQMVNLGLPSGLIWAKYNLTNSGFVSNTVARGYYYGWAENTGYAAGTTHDFYNSYSTTAANLSGNVPSTTTYDPARRYLGSGWRLPTSAEFAELEANTTATKKSKSIYDSYKGATVTVPYWEYKSKTNSNVLEIPAYGYYDHTSLTSDLSWSMYWSSTLYTANDSYSMMGFGDYIWFQNKDTNRRTGAQIRPVI